MVYATVDQLLVYLSQLTQRTGGQLPDAEIRANLADVLRRASSILDGALEPIRFAPWPAVAEVRRVRAWGGEYLALPPHQPGTVAEVRYPAIGTGSINPAWYQETADGMLEIIAPTASYPLIWSRGYDRPVWGAGQYEVTAIWGWGPVPASVEEICLELAVNIWRSKDSGGFRETGGVDTAAVIRYVAGLTSAQQGVIDALKDRLIPQAV